MTKLKDACIRYCECIKFQLKNPHIIYTDARRTELHNNIKMYIGGLYYEHELMFRHITDNMDLNDDKFYESIVEQLNQYGARDISGEIEEGL